jgi:hypothetical protein
MSHKEQKMDNLKAMVWEAYFAKYEERTDFNVAWLYTKMKNRVKTAIAEGLVKEIERCNDYHSYRYDFKVPFSKLDYNINTEKNRASGFSFISKDGRGLNLSVKPIFDIMINEIFNELGIDFIDYEVKPGNGDDEGMASFESTITFKIKMI